MPDKPSDIRTAARQVKLAIGRLESLSTLPGVGAQLFSQLIKGQLTPLALADIIESDPALAAKVLSLIGRRGLDSTEVRFSLRQALDKLTTDEIRDAALSVKVAQPLDPDQQLRTGLLLHSLAVACCAKGIAEEIALPEIDSEMAYWAGLLHDLGKLALLETMPKSLARIMEEAESTQQCSCAIEQKHLGIEHTTIGKHLAQRWRLPEPVILAIWLHHSDTVTISQDMPEASIAVVVQLADSIARQSGIGRSGSFDSPEPVEPLAEYLGIDIEHLQEIHQDLLTAVEEKSRVLGLDLPGTASDYAEAVHSAAAQFVRQHAELSEENRRLQSASSHLDFTADFLLGLRSPAAAIDIAENFAVRWQKFYQTGMVCLYLAPPATDEMLEAVVVENLSQSRIVSLSASDGVPIIPKAIANTFAILNAYDHIPWLLEQLDVDFDVNRTKLVPLISSGKAVGAIAFELHYPGDDKLFEDKFKTSTSIVAVVLDMALAHQGHQNFAERFARLISKPGEIAAPVPRIEEHEDARTYRAADSLNALAEMAAGAAHELNNPLAVISGRAQLLAEAQSDPETKEILKQIYENAREASGIIEDLMSFAEPPKPRAAKTNVRKMLDEAVQLTSRKTSREDLDIQIEVTESVGDVFVDSAQIVSALANVISNAVESCGDQSGPIEITAEAVESGEIVKLMIKDRGCGMDAETLKKATQPFFSAKTAGRKRGMGLAYAARFIQINKGTLTITSKTGHGTTVIIHLPCK
ncbi:HDOD domain-containing protein [Planctomycetota bacterium]